MKLKSKRRAKSISSRRKNVKDKTIIIHCSKNSKATKKKWCWFSVYDDVYLHSFFFVHFVILHLLLITTQQRFFWRMILIEKTLKNTFSNYLMKWLMKLQKNNLLFRRSSSKQNFFWCCMLLRDVIIHNIEDCESRVFMIKWSQK
jgi:hypothetical protein